MNIVPGTVNLDPDGVNAYGSLGSPPDVRCPNAADAVHTAVVRLEDRTFPAHECPAESAAVWNVALYELESALASQQTSSSVSAPKWSPTPPTKDGWYWMAESPFLTKPVWVLSGRAQEPDFWDDPFDVVSATETLGLLWYGPIQPPTPPSDSDN